MKVLLPNAAIALGDEKTRLSHALERSSFSRGSDFVVVMAPYFPRHHPRLPPSRR